MKIYVSDNERSGALTPSILSFDWPQNQQQLAPVPAQLIPSLLAQPTPVKQQSLTQPEPVVQLAQYDYFITTQEVFRNSLIYLLYKKDKNSASVGLNSPKNLLHYYSF